ncbi:N-acetylneuraminate synthase family protein [Magnetospirillum fulvum]|uniref:Sialic acid synthase n=1 Tax=Magnetospirillum fulvum TaxID=1082 RepID=A0A1H6H709_MAGFU|nr:N-acetylneuraminate synthase family protein [Magnetospirillum fulvum]SEH30064.1 sialic acid synthase [Magnetospirillum fulvum]
MRELCVDAIRIADDTDCYVIAEIGHNHQGDLEKCKQLFHAAHECGANAVKLQKRDNRSLFTKAMYDSAYSSENAYGDTYGAHREFLEFGEFEYKELRAYAKDLGISFFSTAFDFNSADFLEKLDMPAYKLASGDLTNIPLMKHIASFGKPMFISTGGGSMEDVRRAYEAIMPINRHLCILQCSAGYPPEYEELNLRVIETFRAEFPDIVIGFSSHDSGIAMAVAGYMLGARVVEKHFTLNRAWKGTDHAFSLERPGLQKMVRDLKRTRLAMGDGIKRQYESEKKPLQKMSKKLVAARDLEAGHVLTRADFCIKSPNDGLPPHMMDDLIGLTLAKPLKEDDNFAMDVFAQAPVG